MAGIIAEIIAGIATVVAAVVGGMTLRWHKKEEKLAKQRAMETKLAMDMQVANIELSDVIAIAVTGGHTNGNVEAARKKAHDAKVAYYAFINSVAADTLSQF